MDDSQNGSQVPVQGPEDDDQEVTQPEATTPTDPTEGGGDDQGNVPEGTTAGDGDVVPGEENADAPAAGEGKDGNTW
jgi:hypothetical protein